MEKTANTNKALVVAKYVGATLDEVPLVFGKTNKTPEFLGKFPFGRIPALETPEGPLYESNAIAYYLAATKKPEFLGKTPYEQSLTVQYICSLDTELVPCYSKVIYPIFCYAPYDAAQWQKDVKELMTKLAIYDQILRPRTYLVGESITLADIIFACTLERIFTMIMDPAARKNLVNLTRWFVTMINQPQVKAVLGEVKLAEKVVDPAAEIKKRDAAQSSATTSAAPANDEEDEPAPKPKAKNSMDLLPPSKFNLEDWKRFYSNNETRPTAIDYFWNNFDSEGYSIWRATYKYNDELKKIFMTCNLVTGLFARMDAMRRYCFASVIIFGEDDNNEVSGFFVIRGQEMPELMKEVPDYECYEWTKVDINDPAQRELFEDYLAWDGKLEGKTVNQGKTFK